MKPRILSAALVLSLLLSGEYGWAATTNDVSTELGVIVMTINNKLKSGKDTEKELADELSRFDVLFAEHKDEKTEDVAQILFMKATLYLQVLNNTDKATALFTQLRTGFPGTKPAERAGQMLDSIKTQEEAKNVSAALVAGSAFPDFSENDLAGKPLSIANDKGKVVLIDFWATWCGPCVAELPNVIKTYQKHHDKGLEIIGISLDKDREKLEGFIKQKNMAWPQYFDGKGWENKLAAKYGVTSIPATYLLDREGKIIGKDLRGENLEQAVAKALEKQ